MTPATPRPWLLWEHLAGPWPRAANTTRALSFRAPAEPA